MPANVSAYLALPSEICFAKRADASPSGVFLYVCEKLQSETSSLFAAASSIRC